MEEGRTYQAVGKLLWYARTSLTCTCGKRGSTYEKFVRGTRGFLRSGRSEIPEQHLSWFTFFRLSREMIWGSCSFLLVRQPDRIHPLAHGRHPHLPCSAQTIDFEKNLVPGELWYAQHQLIELTTRSTVHRVEDSVSKSS